MNGSDNKDTHTTCPVSVLECICTKQICVITQKHSEKSKPSSSTISINMQLKCRCSRMSAYFGHYLTFRNWGGNDSKTKRNNGTKAVLIILLLIIYTICDHANLNLLKGYHSAKYSSDTFYGPCVLPVVNPFDPAVMKDRKIMEPINCKGSPSIVFIDSNNILQFNKTALKLSNSIQKDIKCECSEIVRRNADEEIQFSDPINCDPPYDFNSDFLKVNCNRRGENIFSNFLTKVHQKEHFKSNGKKSYNVMLFGIDSVSRSSALREIPNTVKYLKETLKAFDFHGYMKVGDNTFPNLVPLLTGREAFTDELPPINYNEDFYDEFPFIWKNYSEKGYVTLFAEDMPHMNAFNLEKMGFKHPPTDHYMRPYWLAWHSVYSLRQYKAGLALGMLNNKFMKSQIEQYTMCAGDVPNYIAHLNYVKQFIHTYSNKRKFMFSFITELAHNNNNLLHLSDIDLKRFFEDLHKSDHFSNTILIVFSDHGPKTGDTFFTARLEKSLPMLFIVIPKTLQERNPDIVRHLRENEKRLTTHYDLYTTLLDIATGKYASPSKHRVDDVIRGYSLFGAIPEERSCKEAAIPEHFCVCYKAKPLSIENNEFVDKMATAVVDKVNQYLSGKSVCSTLTLNKVLSVQQISERSLKEPSPYVIRPKMQMDTREKYTITVETKPGGGHFYATVSKTGSSVKVSNDIDRVNRYNNQSYCVREHKLRPLCYCKVQ